MVAGLNLKCNIWSIGYQPDDEVGGAVTTGTVAYENVMLSLQENRVEQLLLQQGLETQKTFSANICPGNLDIRERDELEVTFPPNHRYYGERFRIINSRHSSFAPDNPDAYMMLTLIRSVEAHTRQ